MSASPNVDLPDGEPMAEGPDRTDEHAVPGDEAAQRVPDFDEDEYEAL